MGCCCVSIPSSSGLRSFLSARAAKRSGESQSLLRQVCVRSLDMKCPKCGGSLNPFFVRSAFVPTTCRLIHNKWVSIPSSSGLRSFIWKIYLRRFCFVSIPSSSGLRSFHGHRLHVGDGKVSIPSSSGLRSFKHREGLDRACPSQSLLRQVCVRSFRVDASDTTSLSQSLLRQVCVRSQQHGRGGSRCCVSIPSSSGLRSFVRWLKGGRWSAVSIPSSSGLRSFIAAPGMEPTIIVSIPSSSGLRSFLYRFQLLGERDVSIPSSSGLRSFPPV